MSGGALVLGCQAYTDSQENACICPKDQDKSKERGYESIKNKRIRQFDEL